MQVSNGVRMWCVIASIVSVLIAVSMCADMASADAITVVYRGTEVLEAGEPPFNVYYIDCKPNSGNENTLLDIKISYVDGTIENRTGEYCNTKLYVNGTLHSGVIVHDDGTHAVIVVGAVSAPGTPAGAGYGQHNIDRTAQGAWLRYHRCACHPAMPQR